jgi:glutaredoxin
MSKFLIWVSLAIAGLWMSTGLAHEQPASASNATSQSRVVMYATATCGYCAQARAYFKQRGVEWEERDIDASAQARSEWKELGGFATPLIVVNGQRLIGFSQVDLDAELAKFGK